MNLVIVESPAKGRTIEKYLGPGYKVVASFGHVRDLPKKELGVDVLHDFEPKYVIPSKARKTVSMLKDQVSKSDVIYMATDYDREGEAIAWHIAQAVGLGDRISHIANRKNHKQLAISHKLIKRITFHEITKDAIQKAIKSPRDIDMNLVDAQQARRILDRLVGYKLSPFLWHKVFKGLSAGRVQSVAVRLIVDREREIKDFKPEEYWDIRAKLKVKSEKLKVNEFIASLVEKDGKKIDKLDIKSEKEAQKIIKELENANYKVKDIEEEEKRRWPYPPFTTSTLQQEASKRLYFSAKKTMKLAQDLYEDGLITYMRTDSVSLAPLAISTTRKLIESEFGSRYLPESPRIYKTKSKGAQEAHEAIRPTHIRHQRSDIRGQKFEEDHLKLYDLIWRRMAASQINPMIIDTISVNIKTGNYGFNARGQIIKFDGFSKVWPVKLEEKTLPKLLVDEILDLIELLREQHFTQPQARYTEASLIKALEEHGIGRPSTYAPTISTIQDRGYVYLDKKVFFPKEVGFIVIDLLVKHFSDIVDLEFTAGMEKDLDKIAEGNEDWVKMLSDFYGPFSERLEEKEKKVEKSKAVEEKTGEKCPKCGKELFIKMGRFGKFIACSGFPECKFTRQIIVETGLKCPDCKVGDVIERKTRKGKTFWGCSKFPKCKWATWENPVKNNN